MVSLDGWELEENLGRSEGVGRGRAEGRLGEAGGERAARAPHRVRAGERRALAAAGTGSGHKGRRKGEQTQREESGQRASG